VSLGNGYQPALTIDAPGCDLKLTSGLRSSFMFAVDSYLVTHSYAAVFLVLLYDRGCIDGEPSFP
jgi:hypothetical protein